MALLKSTQAAAKMPVPNADRALEDVPVFADYTMTGAEASGDIIEMLPIPPNMVPITVVADPQSLGVTATADVGILSGKWLDTGARTMGAEFMTGKTFQTAGIYRNDVAGSTRIAPDNTAKARSIGIKLTTVGTPTAGAKVRLTAHFRPQIEGV